MKVDKLTQNDTDLIIYVKYYFKEKINKYKGTYGVTVKYKLFSKGQGQLVKLLKITWNQILLLADQTQHPMNGRTFVWLDEVS